MIDSTLRIALTIGALVLSPGLAPSQEAPSEEEQVFEQELARVHKKMEAGDWDVARKRLERALASHSEGPYLLTRLGGVELSLKRCVFWSERPEQDVPALFKGELISHKASSGKLHLRYEEDKPHDFVMSGLSLTHAIEFSGPYSITIDDNVTPSLLVCTTSAGSVQVSYGRVFNLGVGNPAHKKPIQRWVEITRTYTDERGMPKRESKRKEYTSSRKTKQSVFEIKVTGTQVKASFNGKSLLSVKKPKDAWGKILIPAGGPHGVIDIEGDASEWLKRQRDRTFQAEWKRFEAGWKLEDHLPPELAAKLASAVPTEVNVAERGKEPSELGADQVLIWNAAVEAWNDGNYEIVLVEAEKLLALEPDVGEARFLAAQALLAERRVEEAIGGLADCVERHPSYREAVSLFAQLLLRTGRFEEARTAISRGVGAGVPAAELQSVSITAEKAIHGPPWKTKHAFDSRHYRVASDLSRETCRAVALELEGSFRYISRRLGEGQHEPERMFQVFVFAGKASYLDYVEDVFGGRGDSTQGMYSPFLKQLLVLDSEPRESLMHTVRHEGFHQYLDSLLDEPPIWFNEGLAEYFAAAHAPTGEWREGRLLPERLAVLTGDPARPFVKAEELQSLRTFLHTSQVRFMTKARRNYAQAWALVHYLRHSTRQNRAIFDRLFAELLAGTENREAIDRAFDGVDLKQMDTAFASYVQKL